MVAKWEQAFEVWMEAQAPDWKRLHAGAPQVVDAVKEAFHAGWKARKLAEYQLAYGRKKR
jgi:hypothetical protein